MNYLLSVLCLFLLAGQAAFSQIQSGEITYKIRMTDNFSKFYDTIGEKENIKRFFSREYASLKSTVPYLNHKIIFNDKGAFSKVEKVMNADNGSDIKNAMAYTYTDNQYVYNFKEHSSIQQFKSFRETILLKHYGDSIPWQLHDEYKIIEV